MYKLMGLIILIFLISSCTLPDPDKLGLPTWETRLKLYILNDVWDIAELAEEDSTLYIDNDNNLVYLDSFSEEEEIIIDTDMISDTDIIEKGDIEINDPEPKNNYLQLQDIIPSVSELLGKTTDIGPGEFEVFDEIEEFEEFKVVEFISGFIEVTISNDTIIWLGDSDSGNPLIFRIFSSLNNELLAELFFEDLEPGDFAVDFIDLGGQTYPNQIYFSLSGGTLGTNDVVHNIDQETIESEVHIIIDFEGEDEHSRPKASYAFAIIPEQEISDFFYVPLDENIIIYEAIVDYGILIFDVKNRIDVNIFTTIFIDDIKLINQEQSFKEEFIIERNGEFILEIELEDAIIGKGNSQLDSLMVRVEAFTIDTAAAQAGDRYREIYSSDYIEFNTDVDEMTFKYLRATVISEEQDLISGEKVIDIDYPDIDGDFFFTGDSSITLDIETPVPANIALKLTASNSKGDSVELDELNEAGIPNFSLVPGENFIIFDSEHYNVNSLLSILPEKIDYEFFPIVGDSTTIFEYFKGDMIQIDVNISSNVMFEADCWVVLSEDGKPKNQNIDSSDFTQNFYDAIKSATLKVNYKNTTGVAQSANILMKDREFLHFEQVYYPEETVTIISIPVLETTQETDDETKSLDIVIEQDDLYYFVEDSLFIVPKLQLFSEGDSPLSGSIYMNAFIEVIFEISDGLTE